MEDNLIITYDNCPPDKAALLVARQEGDRIKVLRMIFDNEAFGIYHYLTDGAELKSIRDISKKVKKEKHFTIHPYPHFIYTHHCPNCNHLVEEYEDKGVNPPERNNYCNVCGQKLDWK